LIPGDGIGPEITEATLKVLEATGLEYQYEEVIAGEEAIKEYGTIIPDKAVETMKRIGVVLKAPITTPVGQGFRSANVTIREMLNLYANIRPVKSFPGVVSRCDDVDLVIVRENTEDLYVGIEHMVGEDAAESIKIITKKASERIADFAFKYALDNRRKKVTAAHKANILKLSDGLFLKCCMNIAENYPEIEFNDFIVDNLSMQLVKNPQRFDVIVAPNLYGDIISDLCAGLVGGLGLAPGANIGDTCAMFEPVHGSAPKHAGKNKVNPGAMILAASMMLKYVGENRMGSLVEEALGKVLAEGKHVTYDVGGTASTIEMGEAVADMLIKLKD